MAWDSDTSLTIEGSGAVAGTELYTTTLVTHTPGEWSHVQVTANSGGTTDSLIIRSYGTLDASSEVWDTVPLFQFTLDCTSGANCIVSFTVPKEIYKWRLGFVRTGSTDTIQTSANYRASGQNQS